MTVEYPFAVVGEHRAPYLPITLSPLVGHGSRETFGLLDTRADRSVIPLSVAREFELPQVRELRFEGADGVQFSLPVFRILLAAGPFPAEMVTAAGSANEEITLIGRDVMETFRILLDGPAGVVRLDQE